MESEADYWMQLATRHLLESEALGGLIIVIGDFLRFWLRIRQWRFHYIIVEGIISGIWRKWNRSDSFDCDCVDPHDYTYQWFSIFLIQ